MNHPAIKIKVLFKFDLVTLLMNVNICIFVLFCPWGSLSYLIRVVLLLFNLFSLIKFVNILHFKWNVFIYFLVFIHINVFYISKILLLRFFIPQDELT